MGTASGNGFHAAQPPPRHNVGLSLGNDLNLLREENRIAHFFLPLYTTLNSVPHKQSNNKMDGLSIAASILAVIQVADRVISLCKFYLALSRDAPSDIRIIWIETSSLRTILDNIQFLAANGHGSNLNTLAGSDGPVEGCRKALGELSGLFPSDNLNANACDGESGDRSQPKRRKLKDVWATLAWPFKEGTARKLLVEIAHHKTTLNLALTADIR